MRRFIADPALFILGLTLLFFIYLFSARMLDYSLTQKLDEAASAYQTAIKAKNISEREIGFNTALKIYQQIDDDYKPGRNSALFYYDLGNTYYQLASYPYAIVNYEKAKRLLPNDQPLLQNLEMAKQKLDLPKDESVLALKFYGSLSLNDLFMGFHLSLFLTFIFSSWLIWKNSTVLKRLALFFAVITALLLVGLIWNYYMSPLEAVVVEPSFLYKGAGEEYAKVADDPLKAGIKVEVIGANYNGEWLKVLTTKGEIGYLSKQKIERTSF